MEIDTELESVPRLLHSLLYLLVFFKAGVFLLSYAWSYI